MSTEIDKALITSLIQERDELRSEVGRLRAALQEALTILTEAERVDSVIALAMVMVGAVVLRDALEASK